MKLVTLVLSSLISISAWANNGESIAKTIATDSIVKSQTRGQWVVSDEADYNLNIGGFIKGSMHSQVREEVHEGFWIQQDMDLGFMGKQKVEMLIDHSGSPLQLLVNGEKQEIPNPDDQEIIEMEETTVTVPAGTLDAIYVKVLNKKDNSESEAWINPQDIPVMGLVKQVAPSQMGEVVVELTGYEKH